MAILFFQLLVIEIHQEMNQIMSYLKYETGLINGEFQTYSS